MSYGGCDADESIAKLLAICNEQNFTLEGEVACGLAQVSNFRRRRLCICTECKRCWPWDVRCLLGYQIHTPVNSEEAPVVIQVLRSHLLWLRAPTTSTTCHYLLHCIRAHISSTVLLLSFRALAELLMESIPSSFSLL
jgi:hypothetical protein